MDWSILTDMLLRALPALLCITIHELCHGLVAYKLGDDTAKRAGRLTLNPIKHIDLFGLVLMIAFRFGWAKPVPVDMRKLRHPKRGMALVALAGPVSNLLLAIVLLFLYGALYIPLMNGKVGEVVLELLMTGGYLSCALAVFNMIPIPPLDGSKVLFSFLPDEIYRKILRYERYFMILLFALVATRVLSGVLSTATGWIVDRLWVFAQWGFALALKFVG
ncbi:MAG: site-2 protease family protein [Ruminococcaceae bacterium]|nr:site-2 protease family protein [Oscillospiraceae bacterium]